MAKTVNMTRGKPLSLLLGFALPMMFGSMFQQLYTVVDTAIVGKGVGLTALAALGTVDWLNWMFLAIAQGFTQSFAVRISQKFGQGDHRGLKHICGQSAFLAAVLALGIMLFGQLLLPVFLWLLQVPNNLYAMAIRYTRILLAGFPAVMLFNYCSSVLRAVGDSKTPLYAMIAASVCNIILDCVAVFALRWGIGGAALATVISQLLSGIICSIKIFRNPLLRFASRQLKPEGGQIKDFLLLGTPLAGKNMIIAAGGMVVQAVVNRFSLSFIGGYVATNKLYGLLEIAAISYGYAVTTYVGQNFGASKFERISRGIRSACILSIATSVMIAGIIIVFGKELTMLFIDTKDAALAVATGKVAYDYLLVMALFLPVLYLLHLYQSALQGMGDSVKSMLSGILEFIMRVGGAIAIAFTGWRYGIFFTEVSAWVAAAIYLIICYYISFRKRSQKSGC